MAYQYPGISVRGIEDDKVKRALRVLDTYIKQSAASLTMIEGGGGTEAGSGGTLPITGTYVCLSNHAFLTNERRLTVGSPLSLTDNGANSSVVINLTLTSSPGEPDQSAGGAGLSALPARGDHWHPYSDRIQIGGQQLSLADTGTVVTLGLGLARNELILNTNSGKGTIQYSGGTISFSDDATNLTGIIATNRGGIYARGASGVYGDEGFIGCIKFDGSQSMYFDSSGDLFTYGATSRTWTINGSVTLRGSDASIPGVLVGQQNAGGYSFGLVNSASTLRRKWATDTGAEELLYVGAHFITRVAGSGGNTGFRLEDNNNRFSDTNGRYFAIFDSTRTAPQPVFEVRAGASIQLTEATGVESTTLRPGMWALSNIPDIPASGALLITTAGSEVLFDNTTNDKAFVFRNGTFNGAVFTNYMHFVLDRSSTANDAYFRITKQYGDGSTDNDLVQIIHSNATVGGSRNLLSITVGSDKVIAFDKTTKLTVKDQSSSNAYHVKFYFDSASPDVLTADREFVVDLQNDSRRLTLNGNVSLGDWFNQAVKSTSTPTFYDLVLSGGTLNTIYCKPSTAVISNVDGSSTLGQATTGRFGALYLYPTTNSTRRAVFLLSTSNLNTLAYNSPNSSDTGLWKGVAALSHYNSVTNDSVSNSTTEGNLADAAGGYPDSYLMPSNFWVVGRAIRYEAWGYISTKASSAGTLRFRLRKDGTSGTVILDTTAQTLPDNLSNKLWRFVGFVTCRTTGATGTLMAQGYFEIWDTATSSKRWQMVNTGTVTVDTTAEDVICISAQFGTADAGNSITCTNVLVAQEV